MRAGVRRALHVTAGFGVLWAAAVHTTGGFVVPVETIRITSRSPHNAWVVAVVAGLLAAALSWPDVHARMRDDARWWRDRLAAAIDMVRAQWAWVPAALLAVAAVALLVHEWAQGRPLWLDEQMIAINLRERSLAEIGGPLWLGQAAPYGWLVLQRLALVMLGDGEPALRLVPALFAAATVATAWWVGRRWLGPVGATVLVVLCVSGEWVLYYALELKHYSADVFFGLWLPALAVWAADAAAPRDQTRRHAVWWTAAAAGQWVSNGALLVAPGCAVVLGLLMWQRHGWRTASRLSGFGLIWIVSFGAHYAVAVRHTMASTYLGEYWAFAMAPEGAGVIGALQWLAATLEPLAVKPGGSAWGLLFWLAAAAGMAAAVHRPLGLVMATVPLSAFLLAALRLVPLFERLSLWMVPALYVGIALLADRVMRRARDDAGRPSRLRGLALLAAALLVVTLSADIVWRARGEISRTSTSNHALDDRTGVRWLLLQRRPGDVILTTRLALPAVWWYGDVPIESGGGQLADGTPILEVGYRHPDEDCRDGQLGDALQGRGRALVYFGFRFDDVPAGFDGLLLNRLKEIASVRAVESFTDAGRAVIFDIGVPMDDGWAFPPELDSPRGPAPPLAGCLDVRAATRW